MWIPNYSTVAFLAFLSSSLFAGCQQPTARPFAFALTWNLSVCLVLAVGSHGAGEPSEALKCSLLLIWHFFQILKFEGNLDWFSI